MRIIGREPNGSLHQCCRLLQHKHVATGKSGRNNGKAGIEVMIARLDLVKHRDEVIQLGGRHANLLIVTNASKCVRDVE